MTLVIGNVRAVLPDRVLDDATVVVEDGLITAVTGRAGGGPGVVDGRGAFLLPGLVDTHSDGLEREVSPRPGTTFPIGFALRSFEGKLRAAGVTTVFHGVAFEDHSRYGRSVELAVGSCAAIAEAGAAGALVDHRVLYRVDARTATGVAALLDQLPATGRPLVSLEDHTPGQGQFRDLERFAVTMASREGGSIEEASRTIAERIDERDALLEHVARNRSTLAALATADRITLFAHDAETIDDVEGAREIGARVAEFPLTVEAAGAARRHGMAVVMGAPNALRGGSHSGNVAAETLVVAGLCTVLASDYQPSTLLAAVFGMADRGVLDLPRAVGLVTSAPAAMAGLPDRGRLVPGQRADVVLTDVHGGWPRVLRTWRAEDVVLAPA